MRRLRGPRPVTSSPSAGTRKRFRGDDDWRTQLGGNGIALLEQDAVRFLGERGDLQGVELGDGRVLPASPVT